jgi:hypothetical protein
MPVDFLVGRGRLVMVAAFVLAGALFATGAVAFVLASRDDKKTAVPRVHPSLIIPTQEPSETPSPTPSPTPAATRSATPSPAAVVTASPSATRSASPAPRATQTSPRPKPTKTVVAEGLSADASLDRADGGTAGQTYEVTGHATDGDGTIYLKSINWGDGTLTTLNARGTACSPAAVAPADCRNYVDYRLGRQSHIFSKPGSYTITVTFVSGDEAQVLHLTAHVSPAPPSPTPTHT